MEVIDNYGKMENYGSSKRIWKIVERLEIIEVIVNIDHKDCRNYKEL